MRSRPRPPSLYSQKPRSEPTASPHCLRFAVPLRLPDQRIHGRLGQALHPGLPALKGTGVGALAAGLASRSSQPARTGGPAGGLPDIASLRGGLSVRCHPRSRAADPGPSPGSGRMASPLLLLRPLPYPARSDSDAVTYLKGGHSLTGALAVFTALRRCPPCPMSCARFRCSPSRLVQLRRCSHHLVPYPAMADSPTTASGPRQADGQGPAVGDADTRAGAQPLISAKIAAVRCTRRARSHTHIHMRARAYTHLLPPVSQFAALSMGSGRAN